MEIIEIKIPKRIRNRRFVIKNILNVGLAEKTISK